MTGTANLNSLQQPFAIKSLQLTNRIVMAPMTRSFAIDGLPSEQAAAYYRRRAEASVGLILSEGTVVDRPAAKNEPNVPHFYGELALSRWRNVIDEVHAAGGKMGPQLWHVGAMRNPVAATYTPPGPVDSPSGYSKPGKQSGEPMTDEAIADTIDAFGQAAAHAKDMDFDIVEIHGAHGYLLDQFFWSGTNERTDAFGGATLPERARFAAEVVKSVRAAVGPDFPISLRLSQWKQQDFGARLAETPEQMDAWLAPLADAGVDVFHCSQRRFWDAEFSDIDGEDGLNFAGWAKKLTGLPTISVGSVGLSGDFVAAFGGEASRPAPIDNLIRRMDRGEFDLIAVGRALIADDSWASKVLAGENDNLVGFAVKALGRLV